MTYLKMNSLIFFSLMIHTIQSFSANEINTSTFSFQNSTIHFSTTKSPTNFTFSDSLGERKLMIKECNKKIIEEFWVKMVKVVNKIQVLNIKGRKPSNSIPWIKYEGVELPILSFDPALHFFNGVPNDSHVLFSESKRLCRKK